MQDLPVSPVVLGVALISIIYIAAPQLNVVYFNWWTLVVLCSIGFVYSKKYTFWLIYKTLPRDLKAVFRYSKLTFAVRSAQWGNKSIAAIFKANVEKNPNKVAFICDGREWTFRQVDEYSNRVGNYFIETGYTKGDCVGLYMTNCVEYICIWLGAAKVGVIVALVNSNLKHSSLVTSLQSAQCKLIITDKDLLQGVREIQDEVKELPVWVHDFSLDNQEASQMEGLGIGPSANPLKNAEWPPECIHRLLYDLKKIKCYVKHGLPTPPPLPLVTSSNYGLFCVMPFSCTVCGMVDEYSNRVGNYFIETGYTKGDCVGLYMTNCVEYIGIWLGAAKYIGIWLGAAKLGNCIGLYMNNCIEYICIWLGAAKVRITSASGLGLTRRLWIRNYKSRFGNAKLREYRVARVGVIVALVNTQTHTHPPTPAHIQIPWGV
ncbi:unnamed protein product, partial [Meganyctiphanes norvegica]